MSADGHCADPLMPQAGRLPLGSESAQSIPLQGGYGQQAFRGYGIDLGACALPWMSAAARAGARQGRSEVIGAGRVEGLAEEEEAAPGVGEEVLVAIGGPAALDG
jgi:hypothetical protein